MYEKIEKIIARDGTREVVESDEREWIDVRNGIIPDFDDESIICIKFVFSISNSSESSEESSWFINPVYMDKFINLSVYDEFDEESYAPFINEDDVFYASSEFIPEILLLDPPEHFDIFEVFEKFYNYHKCDISSFSLEESMKLFIEFLEEYVSEYS